MKKVPLLVGLGLVILAVTGFILMRRQESGPLAPPPAPTQESQAIEEGDIVAEIRMDDNKYDPETLTIRRGQAIRFTNADTKPYWPASNIHPTHEIYSEFDPKRAIPAGESWTFRFDQAGSWRMHDHLYPFIKGIITVE
jgi:plastocyanin